MDWGSILLNTVAWVVAPTTIAYALATVGLGLHFGFTGLLNFGMAGFMAVGAYGYAMTTLNFGLPWWVGILVAIVAAAIFALILGIPTLRLRADYLAIATIAAAEVVRLVFSSTAFQSFTGGSNGPKDGYNKSFRDANPFPDGTYSFGPWSFTAPELWVFVFGIILLGVSILLVWLLIRSPWGRVLKGIREDEDAVRALGKNVFAYKMQALVIGGVIGALGGVLFTIGSALVPSSYVTSLTFFLWTSLLLGGAATVFGPALGALLFWVVNAFLSNLLPQLASVGVLPVDSSQAGALRFVLVGAALVLIVVFRPQGILGNRKELTFVK